MALLLFGFLFPFLLLEAGLRLFAPQPLAVNVSEWHPVYGWRNRPGAKGFFQTTEFRFPVTIDSLGLRDTEVSRQRPPGTYRILGLGDSFAFGHGVDVDSCFLTLAEHELDRRSRAAGGPAVEVLNAGVGKWGTAQQSLFLDREGWGFEPDAVLLAFCVDNDFEDNESESVLKLRGGQLERVPLPEPTVRSLQRFTQGIPFYGFLAENSHAVNFMRIKASVMETRRHSKRATSPEAGGAPADTNITQAILDRMVASARTHGVPLFVLFVPGISEAPPPGWVRTARFLDPAFHHQRVVRLMAHLDSLGVPSAYPVGPLREAALREGTQHFPVDCHLNERGSRVVARELVEALVAYGRAPAELVSPR